MSLEGTGFPPSKIKSNKYLKRFNARIFGSNPQKDKEYFQSIQTRANDDRNSKVPQLLQKSESSKYDRYLGHIYYIEQQLIQKQNTIGLLKNENIQLTTCLQKIKRNYQHLKQQNRRIQAVNLQLQQNNYKYCAELETTNTRLRILELEHDYEVSTLTERYKILRLSQTERTPRKIVFGNMTPTKLKDVSASCETLPTILQTSQNSSPYQKLDFLKITDDQPFFAQKNDGLVKQLQQQIEILRSQIKTHQNVSKDMNKLTNDLKTKEQAIYRYLQAQKSKNNQLQKSSKQKEQNIQLVNKQLLKEKQAKRQKQIQINQLDQIQKAHTITKKCFQEQILNLNNKIIHLAQLIQQEDVKQQQFVNNELLKKIQQIEELQEQKEHFQQKIKLINDKLQKKQKQLDEVRKQLQIQKIEIQKSLKDKQKIIKQRINLEREKQVTQKTLKQIRQQNRKLEIKISEEYKKNKLIQQKQSKIKQQNCHKTDQFNVKQNSTKQLEEKLQIANLQLSQLSNRFKQMAQTTKQNEYKILQKQNQIWKIRSQVIQLEKSLLIERNQHQKQLESYKTQCQSVVNQLSSQLQSSLENKQTLSQKNVKLALHIQLMEEQSFKKQQQIELLKQQIQNLKQLFQEQKLLLQEQVRNQLQEERQKVVQKMDEDRNTEWQRKENSWRNMIYMIQRDKTQAIQELQSKIKELQYKMEQTEQRNLTKQEQIVVILNQKNSVIEQKTLIIHQKQLLIQRLNKSKVTQDTEDQ